MGRRGHQRERKRKEGREQGREGKDMLVLNSMK